MLDTAFFGNELIPALNRGLLVSLALIIPAGSLGFVGGVLLGCARSFGPRWLRRMPMAAFGILMSLEPALGALAGFLVLSQPMTPLQMLGTGLVVAASAGVTSGGAEDG